MAFRLPFYCCLRQRPLSMDANRHTVPTLVGDQMQDREPWQLVADRSRTRPRTESHALHITLLPWSRLRSRNSTAAGQRCNGRSAVRRLALTGFAHAPTKRVAGVAGDVSSGKTSCRRSDWSSFHCFADTVRFCGSSRLIRACSFGWLSVVSIHASNGALKRQAVSVEAFRARGRNSDAATSVLAAAPDWSRIDL